MTGFTKSAPEPLLRRTLGEETHQFLFALEIQHVGRMTTDKIRQKVRNYLTIEEHGLHLGHLDLPDDVGLWVLFLATQGAAQARMIRAAIEAEMKAQGKRDVDLFRIAPLTEGIVYLEPVWKRPFRQEERALFSG